MADKAGAYSPLRDAMAQRFADARLAGTSTQEPLYGQSPQTNVDAEMRSRMAQATSEGQGPAMAQRFADARLAGTSTQEPLYGQSPQTNVDAEMRSRMAQATSDGQGPAMGQRFADVMNPPPVKPGNYVWSDLNNLGAGGEQYHYNVTYDGTVQFRSPISGKMITLKPSDTAPHKKKAYEAIMKQIAQAQKVSS